MNAGGMVHITLTTAQPDANDLLGGALHLSFRQQLLAAY